ncbi:sensor histidine kinase [Halalkalibacterium halodurans]|uniref:histidine kinase n=2 Tax=Halalkalibacterium halodurans TaxID=86665 RepID=A0A0M0KKW5_ALKHA|nr:sensor histidine kinase [Halalkalibacterium halodurans]TPE67947.1 sensor histidine kinase [Halalkalibacterium halodurans]
MGKSYFIWLAVHFVIWVFVLLHIEPSIHNSQLASICLFFIILFILPLFKRKPWIQAALFSIQALTTLIVFYPTDNGLNLYALLVHGLIIAEAVFYLSRWQSFVVMGVQLGSAAWIMIHAILPTSAFTFSVLFYLLVAIAMLYHQSIHRRGLESEKKKDALLDEYRKMKRQLLTEEEQARQDERMLIGHEIHDSVGHKLTALVMQLEAFRLTAAEQDKETIESLKVLAERSLEETRRAVKSFKHKEVGGLQGVIRLIRKLEMESFMNIHFSVKHGAFAAPLTGEQSFAIYRAIQEALTNIMKHSSTREAQVLFESPGGSVFRFEVLNAAPPNPFFQEGYGLKGMRERLEKVGGSLDIVQNERQFIVTGSIRLFERRGSYDQGIISGRSSNGSPRLEGHDRDR